jgi:hypothetical protein
MRLTLWGIALLLFGMIAGVLFGHGLIRYQEAIKDQEHRDGGMSKKLAKVEFRETTLEQAVEQLHHETHANISVNWHALELAGIERTARVTMQLKEISLRRVLDLMCSQIAASNGEGVHLASQVHDGVIVLSTPEEFASHTTTKIYEVRDLIVADHDLRGRIERLLHKVSSGYEDDSLPSGELKPLAKADSVESLIKAIEAIVEPDSWRDAGGTIGTVREFGGRLIILQTSENHEHIAELLEQLRNS